MRKRVLILMEVLAIGTSLTGIAQQTTGLPSAPLAMAASTSGSSVQAPGGDGSETLTRQQAEQLALKNNPRISVAALLALAQKQVVREARSTELPSLYGNGTAVGA